MLKNFTQGISSHFSTDPLKHYRLAKEPRCHGGHQNLWCIFDATEKDGGNEVSVFTCHVGEIANRCDPGKEKEVVEMLKASVSTLSRIRHPDILKIVQSVAFDGKKLSFVTERVISTLALQLKNSSSEYVSNPSECMFRMFHCTKALSFLHESARLLLLNFCPNTIFVVASREWKIGEFIFATAIDDSGRMSLPNPIPHGASFINPIFYPNLDYTAPEILEGQLSVYADAFSFGCVLHEVLQQPAQRKSLLKTAGDVSVYKRQIHDLVIHDALRMFLSTETASSRPLFRQAASFEVSPFSNPFLETLVQIEELSTLDAVKKLSTLKQLYSMIEKLGEGLLVSLVIPKLLAELVDDRMDQFVLPILNSSLSHLSSPCFSALLRPVYLKFLQTQKSGIAQLLLEGMDQLRPKLLVSPEDAQTVFSFLGHCIQLNSTLLPLALKEAKNWESMTSLTVLAWQRNILHPTITMLQNANSAERDAVYPHLSSLLHIFGRDEINIISLELPIWLESGSPIAFDFANQIIDKADVTTIATKVLPKLCPQLLSGRKDLINIVLRMVNLCSKNEEVVRVQTQNMVTPSFSAEPQSQQSVQFFSSTMSKDDEVRNAFGW